MAAPFTVEDKKAMDKLLTQIDEAKKDISRAELAGLDMTEQKALLLDSETKLRKIKQAYFPTGR